MKKDVRYIESEEIEIRSDDETEEKFVEGIGIVYGRETEILPGFLESVRKGAFDRSINGGKPKEIKSFFNHDPHSVLATTRSKPKLILEDTERGLRFRAPIPPTTYGNDLTINLERKNVRGASFSFSVDEDVVTWDEKDVMHREIVRGTLYEIGPVTNPAYPSTKVGLRDAESFLEERKKLIGDKKRADDAAAVARLELRKKITKNHELKGVDL